MSLLTNSKRSPVATAAPRFSAGARPTFLPSGNHLAPNSRDTASEPSDEPLSTTTISMGWYDCAKRLGKQTRRCSAPFRLAMIADTLGLMLRARNSQILLEFLNPDAFAAFCDWEHDLRSSQFRLPSKKPARVRETLNSSSVALDWGCGTTAVRVYRFLPPG